MLTVAEAPRSRGAGLQVLHLGGGDVDTATPMRSMVCTAMAARAQRELGVDRERITASVATHRAAGKDLGGRRQTSTDSQICNALRLIEGGEPATQVARDLGMPQAILYRWTRELPVTMGRVRRSEDVLGGRRVRWEKDQDARPVARTGRRPENTPSRRRW